MLTLEEETQVYFNDAVKNMPAWKDFKWDHCTDVQKLSWYEFVIRRRIRDV